MLRIASQAPQAVELTEFVLGNFDKPTYTFSADLIGVGQRLITQKRYDAGLAALVGAAHRDLAGRDGVTRVRDNMFRLTPRLARVLEGAIANHLARTLDYFAATLAQSSNYSGAVHVRLLAQLISGDVDRFKQFGRILFGIEGEALFKEPEEPVEISVDLFRKGYRTQAIELLVASTGAIDAESTRWQKMYEALPDNAHLWSILPDRISVIPH